MRKGMGMAIGKLCILWLLSWQIHSVLNGVEGQNLQVGFYGLTCPTAEAIVTNTVSQAFLGDNTITASLIRLLFHDCFVMGCDASILLTGNNTEQLAIPNLTVRGYDVITAAKVQLEAVCPGIVSCADIIALAARDSVGLLGGPKYQVQTGRLDGLVPGIVILPAPTDDVETTTPLFAAVGLTQQDMVTLLGAHSVGTSQCQFFSNRLYNFNNTAAPDPTMNATYLLYLQNLCPQNGTGTTIIPLNSISEFVMDTSYYTGVRMRKGLLIIDQDIAVHPNTSVYVNNYDGVAKNLNLTFSSSFVTAYNKMATIGLKTSLNAMGGIQGCLDGGAKFVYTFSTKSNDEAVRETPKAVQVSIVFDVVAEGKTLKAGEGHVIKFTWRHPYSGGQRKLR